LLLKVHFTDKLLSIEANRVDKQRVGEEKRGREGDFPPIHIFGYGTGCTVQSLYFGVAEKA